MHEKLVKSGILMQTEHRHDSMQFVYRPPKGVDDSTVTLLNLIVKHQWESLPFSLRHSSASYFNKMAFRTIRHE